jgi:hypothetical protein
MSDVTGGAATGGQIGRSDQASGGTPTESDLPDLQGLDSDVDDPSDPQRGGNPEGVPLGTGSESGTGASGSDPMPDISGAGGG